MSIFCRNVDSCWKTMARLAGVESGGGIKLTLHPYPAWSGIKFTLHPYPSSVRQFSTSDRRAEREVFVREAGKLNINLGTLGTTQHGKTTLVSAMTSVLNRSHGVPVRTVADIDHSASERSSGMSQNATHIELWTDRYRYSLTDLPGHPSYTRNTLTHLNHLDMALLVINPEEGVTKDTRDLYHMARHYGVRVVPVLSCRPGTDHETLDLVRMDMADLDPRLGEECVVVEDAGGAGQGAGGVGQGAVVDGGANGIKQLLTAIEERVPSLIREEKEPFYFPLEQVGNIPNRGVFCAGRVTAGSVKVGDQLSGFYNGQSCKVTVRDVEIFKKLAGNILAGDRGGLFVRLKPEIELKRGGVLFDPKVKGLTVAAIWQVNLKPLPGQSVAQIKGEYGFYHSTHFDGKVKVDPVELTEEEFRPTAIHLSHPIMGRSGDPVILRNNTGTLLGILM